MIPPTPSQAAVLAAIRKLSALGVGPSYDEIMRECGMKSRGYLYSALKAMKEKGLVDYEPFRARTLRGQPGASGRVPANGRAACPASPCGRGSGGEGDLMAGRGTDRSPHTVRPTLLSYRGSMALVPFLDLHLLIQ